MYGTIAAASQPLQLEVSSDTRRSRRGGETSLEVAAGLEREQDLVDEPTPKR
jgi:hypothetical protein